MALGPKKMKAAWVAEKNPKSTATGFIIFIIVILLIGAALRGGPSSDEEGQILSDTPPIEGEITSD